MEESLFQGPRHCFYSKKWVLFTSQSYLSLIDDIGHDDLKRTQLLNDEVGLRTFRRTTQFQSSFETIQSIKTVERFVCNFQIPLPYLQHNTSIRVQASNFIKMFPATPTPHSSRNSTQCTDQFIYSGVQVPSQITRK